MTQPRMRVSGVTIGAPNPRALAAFYARLLGWPVADEAGPRPGSPPEDGWALLRPPSGGPGVSLSFEFEADYVPPVWPSAAGEPQIMTHIDIAVEDLDGAVAWAVDAGATLAGHQPQERVRVMLDPAGHPFCLFQGRV
jgi:catechol 2,3-dioxygenase-like lactoylglutathione lyase family enzyme